MLWKESTPSTDLGQLRMTIEELRSKLLLLIETYVTNPVARDELESLVSQRDVPVKEILAGLTPFLVDGHISEADGQTVRDIAFHYC